MLTGLHIALETAYWLVMGCNLVGGVLQYVFVKGTRQHAIAKGLLYETLPFIVPVLIAQTWLQVAENGGHVNMDTGWNVLGVLIWTWLVKRDYDRDDDDRWTRRGRKIRQRLTIRRQAPAPSGA